MSFFFCFFDRLEWVFIPSFSNQLDETGTLYLAEATSLYAGDKNSICPLVVIPVGRVLWEELLEVILHITPLCS